MISLLLCHLVVLVSLFYYSILSIQLAFGMLIQVLIIFGIIHFIPANMLVPGSIAVFILAWIGQFWGHKVEGKSHPFFKILLFF